MYEQTRILLRQLSRFCPVRFKERSGGEKNVHLFFRREKILCNFNFYRQFSVNRPDRKHKINKFANIKTYMAEWTDRWILLGKYSVFPWSIAGVETCVVVQGQNPKIAFDMGYATRESVGCQHVFISHGHIDHTSGIVHHASRRNLYSLKPATYHMLPALEDAVKNVASSVAQVHGGDDTKFTQLNINPVTHNDTIQLPGDYFVRPFPTVHRAPSQGYIVYKRTRTLKDQYCGLPGPEIGKLVKEGVDIHDVINTPEIAYTGDTTFDVFTSPTNPDLLKVKVLIAEATYIDDVTDMGTGQSSVAKARERGHTHLREFVEHEHVFSHVQNIVLIHMSDKYSANYINDVVDKTVPRSLASKLHLGTYMKERTT